MPNRSRAFKVTSILQSIMKSIVGMWDCPYDLSCTFLDPNKVRLPLTACARRIEMYNSGQFSRQVGEKKMDVFINFGLKRDTPC